MRYPALDHRRAVPIAAVAILLVTLAIVAKHVVG